MKIKILANIIYCLIRLLNLTYRYQFVGLENKIEAQRRHPHKTFIYALWHQNLIGAIFSHIGERFSMVVSESKDGELVAVTCEKFGHLPARGSSTRGGRKALIEIVRNVSSGIPGAITVDGPKGPLHDVKLGIVEVAKLCHCSILPLSPYPTQYWELKSWDRFRVPKPFSKIIVVIGKPISFADTAKKEEFPEIAILIKEALLQGENQAKSNLQS
jgi:lysophospholipid acyltransferase (LPLAT)-like uncharacterized protein